MANKENFLKEYDVFQNIFEEAGFARYVVEQVADIALLGLWDIYEIFKHVAQIPQGGIYLEIGCHLGASIITAHEAAKAFGKNIQYIVIDPFVAAVDRALEIERNFKENTKDIPMQFYKDHSLQVVDKIQDNSIDLMFIDGDHVYGPALGDFIGYWPKLKAGGILLGHDFNYSLDHAGVVMAALVAFYMQEITKLKYTNIFRVKKETEGEALSLPRNRDHVGL